MSIPLEEPLNNFFDIDQIKEERNNKMLSLLSLFGSPIITPSRASLIEELVLIFYFLFFGVIFILRIQKKFLLKFYQNSLIFLI